MVTIINGRAIANNIKENLKHILENNGLDLRVDIIVVGDDPVTKTFIKAKEKFAHDIGVEFVCHQLPITATTEEIIELIGALTEKTNGLVVQLPLPESIDTHAVLSAIPVSKDIDVLNESTFAHFLEDKTPFVPPVAGAVEAILMDSDVEYVDKQIAIVGKGRLVGRPVAALLEKENAHVIVLDSKTQQEEFAANVKNADILISGVGIPNLITKEMIKHNAILIDAGTAHTNGSVVGDISKDCQESASIMSETPGGVGPLTVAVLYRNLVSALS